MPGIRTCWRWAKTYEQALAQAMRLPARHGQALHEDDIFALHMTSGTTGLPKSIGYSNRKYLDSVRLHLPSPSISAPPASRQDVNMLGLPLTGPGSGLVLPTLLAGAALVMPEDFRATTLAALIQKPQASRAPFCRPRPSSTCSTSPDAAAQYRPGSSLTHVPYGSEMMPAPKIAEAIRRFGPIFQQGYGCLEALPPITWLLPHQHVDAQRRSHWATTSSPPWAG